MNRIGFIREKSEIKFLILYVMQALPSPIDEVGLVDCCLVDDAFGYMEFSEAFHELIESKHVSVLEDSSPKLFYITTKGRETEQLFERQIPLSVREKAKKAAMNFLLRETLNEGVHININQKKNGRFAVDLSLGNEDNPILTIGVTTLNHGQAETIESNFRKRPEVIYNAVLKLLMNDNAKVVTDK